MFCANCGAAEQSSESYCKQCGQWLTPTGVERVASPEEKMRTLSSFSGINAIMALVAAILLYAFHLGRDGVHWSVYLAAALCSVIAIHQTISFFFNWQLRQRLTKHRTGDASEVQAQGATPLPDAAAPNALPPARPAPLFGVTEDTTARLREPVPRK